MLEVDILASAGDAGGFEIEGGFQHIPSSGEPQFDIPLGDRMQSEVISAGLTEYRVSAPEMGIDLIASLTETDRDGADLRDDVVADIPVECRRDAGSEPGSLLWQCGPSKQPTIPFLLDLNIPPAADDGSYKIQGEFWPFAGTERIEFVTDAANQYDLSVEVQGIGLEVRLTEADREGADLKGSVSVSLPVECRRE